MPTVSSFYGMLIRMYFNDHEPAHFHVEYAEFKATVGIEDLRIRTDNCPVALNNWSWIGLKFIKES